VVSDAFAGLEPTGFWRHFAALTRIPRPSHEEEQVVAHVLAWADAHGLATRRDDAGNLVVDVPATAGREDAPAVILQGHLDMVCEREPDSPNDPREGRIHVVRDGDWLTAEGTTLGADDGVAIAAMLAVAEDDGAPHGRLELLMTVAEEVGLAGAQALDPALLTGDLLLNLDSEEDGALTIGCAGSEEHVLTVEAPREPLPPAAEVVRVTAGGGRGGHSGMDITAGRANAVKLLAHALRGAGDGVRIAAFDGGASRNAIPRDATAVVAGTGVREAVAAADAAARRTHRDTDPGIRLAVEPAAAQDAWDAAATARFLDLIATLPAGPLAMSPDFAGLVETSSSLGVARTEDGRVTLRCLSRSQDDDALAVAATQIAAAARLAGAAYESLGSYPAWRPDPDAPLLATARRTYAALFGAEPAVTATHGGLETALIGAKRPGLPMLSFGPEIEGPHAPGERLHVPSVDRFMRLLAALLDDVSR
jgi:dipeptidase D